jgi:tetratricopeptide (TPR) repeat protein
VKVIAGLLLLCCATPARNLSTAHWTLVRNSHFEIYSQAGEREGRSALLWFEQLRALFLEQHGLQTGQNLNSHGPVRVIGFQSAREYAGFRLRPGADAYFIGGEAGNYIVMPRLTSEAFGIAAHEYAHLVMHSMGLRLPLWLAEGIAEIFSSVRIGERGCLIGGDLPARTQCLRQRRWIPLQHLLSPGRDFQIPADRYQADLFYSESWALTHMLTFSPIYAMRFSQLLQAMESGRSDPELLGQIYGKSLEAIATDLRAWVQGQGRTIALSGVSTTSQAAEVSELNSSESRLMIADLLLACAELDRAEAEYAELAQQDPKNATVAAALGNIAFRRGDRSRAREQWKKAMQLGIRDATLCYQYAILGDDAGVPADEISQALRRAIELRTDFDDARYKLGLLEHNRGHYAEALAQFRAMQAVSRGRAYAYWAAVATALTETDQRNEAKEAAAKALAYATNAEERASASQLAYIAGTDLTVQFTHDSKGNLRMETARKPHGSDDWNPFIEPSDRIVCLLGRIRKVECNSGKITGFKVESASTAVEVALPDPSHVLIRGGTPEFVCDAEDGRQVAIQYAAEQRGSGDGILRGMQFR